MRPLPRINTAPYPHTAGSSSFSPDTSPPLLLPRSVSYSSVRRAQPAYRQRPSDDYLSAPSSLSTSPRALSPSHDDYFGPRARAESPRRATRQEAAVLKVCALVSFIVACAIGAAAAAVYVARHPEAFSLIYFTTLTLGLLLSLAILVVGASREGQGSARAPLAALLSSTYHAVEPSAAGRATETGEGGAAPADDRPDAKAGAPSRVPGSRLLSDLPDDLLIDTFALLPPTVAQLHVLSLVDRRFRALSTSSVLWQRVLGATPGCRLVPAALAGAVSTADAPGRFIPGFIWAPAALSSSPSPPALPLLPFDPYPAIPIHYPTLLRSRLDARAALVDPAQSPTTTTFGDGVDGHDTTVYCAAAAGRWLVTGSRDRTVCVWRMEPAGRAVTAPACVGRWVAHEGSVLRLAFEVVDPYEREEGEGESLSGPAQKMVSTGCLVTTSSDCTAKLWRVDWGDGSAVAATLRRTIDCAAPALDVKLSREHMVLASKDGTVSIYSRARPDQPPRVFRHHTGAVNALAMHPDPAVDRAVSAGNDGRWVILDLRTGAVVVEMAASDGPSVGFASVAWERNLLMLGTGARSARFYSATSGMFLDAAPSAETVRACVLDVDRALALLASYDGAVRIYSFAERRVVRRVQVKDGPVFCLAWAGASLVIGGQGPRLKLVTFADGLPYLDLFDNATPAHGPCPFDVCPHLAPCG
ncbi:hypothetical protein Q5752_004455 [Cryptotrichosporon argae]